MDVLERGVFLQGKNSGLDSFQKPLQAPGLYYGRRGSQSEISEFGHFSKHFRHIRRNILQKGKA